MESLYSDQELQSLILGFIEGAGDAGASEDAIAAWVVHCEKVRMENYLIDLVLERKLNVRQRGVEFEYMAREACPTPAGG